MASGRKNPKNDSLVRQFGKDAHTRRNAVVPFLFPSPESPSIVCTVSQIQEGGVGGNGGVVITSSDGGEKA